jgi:type IV secretory pathway protease TraF
MGKDRLWVSLASIALFLFTLLIVVLHLAGIGIRINRSESLPHTLFISKKTKSHARGQYVSILHPEFPGIIAKQLIGLPGDYISIRDSHVYINDEECGMIRSTSPSGLALTAISEGVIPDRLVYVRGTNSDSFDSRYQEFGLIPLIDICEELCPLF